MQFFQEAVELGLMNPRYIWIGVHYMSRPLPRGAVAKGERDLLDEWQQSLLYLDPKPALPPLVAEFFAQEMNLSSVALHLADDANTANYLVKSYETDFALAYDSAWIAAAAFSRNSAAAGNPLSNGLPLWGQDLDALDFRGLSGFRIHDSHLEANDNLAYSIQLSVYLGGKHEVSGHFLLLSSPATYVSAAASSLLRCAASALACLDCLRVARILRLLRRVLLQIVGTISCIDCKEPKLDFADGRSKWFSWRDGSSYPDNTPKSNIAGYGDETSTSEVVLIAVIVVGVILIILLLFIGFSYFRIHRHLKQVASSNIDVESPIAKAITLLKVLLLGPDQRCLPSFLGAVM